MGELIFSVAYGGVLILVGIITQIAINRIYGKRKNQLKKHIEIKKEA